QECCSHSLAATKMAQIVPLCSFISFVIHPLDAAQKVTSFGLGYVWLFFILNRCGVAGGVRDSTVFFTHLTLPNTNRQCIL
ncbi:hypothetical protein, partial [Aeromonas salmonicida]|uniref:hypothetical protein n=1 Tax=Aeromonas salmonicida TaxID=645 RepID=UPI003D322541